ncbi:MAG: hypothetical protein GTO13_20100 [Proteobacteria bacterium]|nr:hypothetical protein [Pseudomonadota bacterium]
MLSCRSPFSSMIQKGGKGKRDKQMTLYGARGSPDLTLSGVEIGDPELDRQLVFWCDSPQSFTDWMGRSEVKENVASLVLAERVESLRLGKGFLSVTYSRSGFSLMGIDLRTSLKEEMTPWNVTFVLQKLETLAQSLES